MSLHRTFASLEDFADAVSEQLQCPVTIEDADHRLLAYSSHAGETDEARVATIIGRRVPEKVINKFWKDGVIPRLNEQKEPLVIPPKEDIGLGRRVAVSIRRRGEVLGYIWVIDNAFRLEERDLLVLQTAAEKAANELAQLHKQRRSRQRSQEEVLWQLLSGAPSHEEAAAQLADIGFRADQPLAVAVFRFDGRDEAAYDHLVYAARTTQQLHVRIDTADEGQAVLLVSPPSTSTDYAETVRTFTSTLLRRLPEPEGVYSGAGRLCTDFTELQHSFAEAQLVASMKARYPDLLQKARFPADLGVFRYVARLLETIDPAQDPLPEPLAALAAYDASFDSHLTGTLFVFLTKEGSVNEAAAALHIHVNTLSYRLRRVEEIAGVRLKDTAQRSGLYLDLLLFRDRVC
ncbi:PucR family transcriptional regulator [Alkalicoccus chagannorensis]|uniref:PucR family transcriptional regulator n=1 Tax=Alkalicoccus chagannorensis TaxID=427072 RepID=UPI000407F4C5|nr:helix-turn-helix domain-containing protein [Alkalicoccus chagannorensis]